jgi:hypothetical protein
MGDAVVIIMQPESRGKHVGRGATACFAALFTMVSWRGVCPEMPALRIWSRGRSQRCRDNMRCEELNSWSGRTEERKSERAIESKKKLAPGDDEMTKQCVLSRAILEGGWAHNWGGLCASISTSPYTVHLGTTTSIKNNISFPVALVVFYDSASTMSGPPASMAMALCTTKSPLGHTARCLKSYPHRNRDED